MKVLISPSKTMAYDSLNSTKSDHFQGLSPLSKELKSTLLSFNESQLKNLYKSSDAVVKDALEKLNETSAFKAIELFNGAVFKNLDYPSLNTPEKRYIDKHVAIFSAMYGLVPAKEAISPYRLDLNNSHKPEIVNLTKKWQPAVNDYLNHLNEKLIVDLASTEYRKLIDYKILNKTIVSIDFKDYKDGKFKTLGTYAKMARGQLLKEMAMTNTKTIKGLKELSVMGYTYNEELSDKTHIIYTR